jgi:methylenetetrahydrofolate reductase (NADPH)
MFYDVNIFFQWVKDVRSYGITVPIVPGIMPIQNWQKFQTWVKRENIVVPPEWYDVLLPVQGDDEQVRARGTKLVAEMCRAILENEEAGIKGLHVYTLNLEKGARMLLEELDMTPRREQVMPLPWRPSLTPSRRTETIRPIFWANRVQSYLSRTSDWDEFPNGRWGDSRSPAYGDLDGYPVAIGTNVSHQPSSRTHLADVNRPRRRSSSGVLRRPVPRSTTSSPSSAVPRSRSSPGRRTARRPRRL